MFLRKVKSIGVSFLICTISYFGASQTWQVSKVASIPMAVSNNAVVGAEVNGGKYVYSFGGIDSTKVYSGIHLKSFRYNVQTNSWDTIPDLPDTLGKIAAGASIIDSVIYIFGGYHVFPGGGEKSSNKVHRFNINTNTYLTDGTNIPVPIDDHVQAVWRDSLIYLVTGWSNTTNIPDVQIYDAKNDLWLTGTPVPNDNNYKSFGASGSIFGDTIYYFGGAAMGWNFPARPNLRKGYIDPINPTQISWSQSIPNGLLKGYRSACTFSDDGIHWLGGSAITYNYNGIAYNGSGGVSPTSKNLMYHVNNGSLQDVTIFGDSLPMDLRGIAEFPNGERYLVGGMEQNQKVSNKILKLVYSPASIQENNKTLFEVYPNPFIDKLFIQNYADQPISHIALYNEKLEKILELPADKKSLNTENISSGIYYIEVSYLNGNRNLHKVIKSK